MSNIILVKKRAFESEVEIIERKGLGHPDSIADQLADNFSRTYSNYTIKKFGVLLHHNFDKTAVLGGKSDVYFKKGALINPIRIMLNGRASMSYSQKNIPVRQILEDETKKTLKKIFSPQVNLDLDKDIIFFFNVSDASGPGKIRSSIGARANIFNPNKKSEVKGYDKLVNNDTSIGCGYAPHSKFEKAIIHLELVLNGRKTKIKYPWLGTDIKIMGVRNKNDYEVTICVPQIAKYVQSLAQYKFNLKVATELIRKLLIAELTPNKLAIYVNTRDDYSKNDIYLTVTGSSIESGDEGIVGRGNRVNGLITPFRPMNLEGAAGKNPKYYTGKVYNIAAFKIAQAINKKLKVPVNVFLVSQNGRNLIDPWYAIVECDYDKIKKAELTKLVKRELNLIPEITENFLNNKKLLIW